MILYGTNGRLVLGLVPKCAAHSVFIVFRM